MALYNFATASMSRDELTERMHSVQEDAFRILNESGVDGFEAEIKWRKNAAALVREAVVDTFRLTDPTPIFTDRRTGAQGDSYEFVKLINTLRVVEYSPQSYPQVFTPRKATWTISTSSYEQAFGIPLQKILNGQHTIGEFADMAAQSLVRHYQTLTLTAIDTACAAGAKDLKGRALRTMAAGSDVAKDEIDGALRRMYAFNQGVTIFGSRYALDPIYSMVGALSPTQADLLNARGVVGTYRGAKLVEMVDEENIFYQSFSKVNGIDLEKLIFISSGTPGAILLEKDLSALDWETLDAQKAQWATGVRFEHGILVHTPYRYGVIQLS